MKHRALLVVLPLAAAAAAACSALGKESPFPQAISTNHVGPFRRLEASETPFPGRPAGRALRAPGALDRGSFLDGHLFYGNADPLDAPPERDPTLLAGAIDPAQFEPFVIRRSTRTTELTVEPGDVVLAASEAWEGGFVAEPFALPLDDGRVRLYYAAAGGLGVATAPSPEGEFARDGDGMAFDASGGPFAGALHSPTVGVLGDTYYLYFDDGESVWVATSADGLSFTLLDADGATPEPDPITFPPSTRDDAREEIAYVSPGVFVATSPTGRVTLRLFVEVHLAPEDAPDDDDRILVATATADGTTFERALLPAVESTDSPGHPTIRILPTGDGLLYFSISRGGEPETRAIVMGIEPATTRFDDQGEEATP